jgi:hypothetical protein
MNRRSFFRFLLAAPVAVAVPAIAEPAQTVLRAIHGKCCYDPRLDTERMRRFLAQCRGAAGRFYVADRGPELFIPSGGAP